MCFGSGCVPKAMKRPAAASRLATEDGAATKVSRKIEVAKATKTNSPEIVVTNWSHGKIDPTYAIMENFKSLASNLKIRNTGKKTLSFGTVHFGMDPMGSLPPAEDGFEFVHVVAVTNMTDAVLFSKRRPRHIFTSFEDRRCLRHNMQECKCEDLDIVLVNAMGGLKNPDDAVLSLGMFTRLLCRFRSPCNFTST